MTAFSVESAPVILVSMAKFVWDVVIIGGGPAGLLAAGLCSRLRNTAGIPLQVLLLEQNDRLGRKLLLTGSGRCNISNIGTAPVAENEREPAALREARAMAASYGVFAPEIEAKNELDLAPGPARELLTLFSRQPPSLIFRLLEDPELLDIALVEQEAGRLFPASDSAHAVRNSLEGFARDGGVQIRCGSCVSRMEVTVDAATGLRQIAAVQLSNGDRLVGRRFILATGGCNYPVTGSTGDGYGWLKKLALDVLEPWPALVPILTRESWPAALAGLALPQAGLSVWAHRPSTGDQTDRWVQVGHSMQGPLQFTHRGVSGPVILNASAWILRLANHLQASQATGGNLRLQIDTQVETSRDVLLQTLDKDCRDQPHRMVKTWLAAYVTQALAVVIVENVCKLAKNATLGHLPRAARLALVENLKALPLHYAGNEGFAVAISTAGGLQPREIDWKTMACKQVDNLHVLGDLLSLDRRSGGYSLLVCWAGALAAARACESALGAQGVSQLVAGLA